MRLYGLVWADKPPTFWLMGYCAVALTGLLDGAPSERFHTKAAFLWLSLPDNQTRRYVKKKLQFPQTAANGRFFPANAMCWPFGSLA